MGWNVFSFNNTGNLNACWLRVCVLEAELKHLGGIPFPATTLQPNNEPRFWKEGPYPPHSFAFLCAASSSPRSLPPQCVISGHWTLTTIFATLINSVCRKGKLYFNILVCYENQSVQITTFSKNLYDLDFCWNISFPLLHPIVSLTNTSCFPHVFPLQRRLSFP